MAFDPATKLLPALQLGSRTQDLAYALLHALSQVLAPGCLPAFTSDGLNLYFYALTAHFGQWFTETRSLAKPAGQSPAICSMGRSKRRIAAASSISSNVSCAWATLQLTERLKALGLSGSLNAAFVERPNLTLRHALAALSCRSWATAQLTSELLAHLECWRAYYQFLPSALVVAPAARCAATATGQAHPTPLSAPHSRYGGWSHGPYLVRGGVVSVPRGLVT